MHILMTDEGPEKPKTTDGGDEKPKTTDRGIKGSKMTTQRGSQKGSTDVGSKEPKITYIKNSPDTTRGGTTKGGAISKQVEFSLIVVLSVLVISIPAFKH